MTSATLHRTKTRVLPGKRVEFVMPELEEGVEVEVQVISPPKNGLDATQPRQFRDVIEFLDSLPNRAQTPEDIARIDAEIEEIKNSWGE
jgi:hypothetical protein